MPEIYVPQLVKQVLPPTFVARVDCPATIRPSPSVKAMIVGEAPGRQEVAEKEGFVGGSGRVLDRTLANAGLSRDDFHLSNVVKRRPPNDNFGEFYNDWKRSSPKPELLYWYDVLREEIESCRPNVVVAAGNEAMKALCGISGISNWRGSLLLSTLVKDLKVVPIHHPAWVMRNNWEYYYISQHDIKTKVAPNMASPDPVRLSDDTANFMTSPSLSTVLAFLDLIIKHKNKPWYLDVETIDDLLTCFGLYSDGLPNVCLCVPLQLTSGPYWLPANEAQIWLKLQEACDANPNLSNQNCLYDIDYLLDHGVEPSGIRNDTYVMQSVAYPEYPRGLDFMVSMKTQGNYYKNEGKSWSRKTTDDKLWVYNCKDMLYTPQVDKGLEADLKQDKLYEFYRTRGARMLPIAMEMMRNRLEVYQPNRKHLENILTNELLKVHSALKMEIGFELNVRSGPQVQKLLYEDLSLPIKKKRGKDVPTSEELALKELHAEFPHVKPLRMIVHERHLSKRLSDYINMTLDPDGFMPYAIYVGRTKTGRWSMGTSPKWRGTNAQTIPKIFRTMYQAPMHNGARGIFWQLDLSQAEARVVAWLAQIRFLIDLFNDPARNVHRELGSELFNKQIKKGSLEYDQSKTIVHGTDYMEGYKRIAIDAGLSFDDTKLKLMKYKSRVPELEPWQHTIRETIIKTGRLVTPLGRVRTFYKGCGAVANTGRLPDDVWREGCAQIPQGTVPDILNEGMWKTREKLDWVRWHHQGHDSYLASTPQGLIGHIFAEVALEMAKVPMLINGMELTIPAELEWGPWWGCMKPYKQGDVLTYDYWKSWFDSLKPNPLFDEDELRRSFYGLF